MPDPSWAELTRASPDELEKLYLEPRDLEPPRGVFRGKHLSWLRAGSLWLRPALWLGFGVVPWGVDFERRGWFFGPRWARAGRFDVAVAPSRWRGTDALQLTYERSRLPRFVRRWLYDEVKPLSADLCLGIGGLNTGPGRGEQFFFALRRAD